jgi:DNA-binding transcriptional MerR regulator
LAPAWDVNPGSCTAQNTATQGLRLSMDSFARGLPAANPEETGKNTESELLGGFMFIGELAAETGIDPKTIRFYEREGLLSPPRHGRFRTYMKSDVRRLKDVLTMRRLGVGIAQIRLLIANNAEIMNTGLMANVLMNHLEELRAKQTEIAKQIEETSSILLQCNTENAQKLRIAS